MTFKILVVLILYCYINVKHTRGGTYSFEPPNLKTVLFTETHLLIRCWSHHEVTLLLNRRVMQDLIPRKIPRDLPLILKYLQHLEEVMMKIPPGINQTLVLTALADVMGGYLQAIVIPIANEAYYAGNVDFLTVSHLHEMLDKWKWFLSTDGGTWSQECDMRKIPTKVAVLDLNLNDPEAACQELYVSPVAPPNETDYLGTQTVVAESSRVAIPYFDNNVMPSAIALPFRKRNLYSLVDPKAAFILVNYYTLAMRCLSRNANDVLAFNNYFHLWIVSKVVPHLRDQDKWYPAFGAVMRVVETIKQKGLLASSNPVFVQPLEDDHQEAGLGAGAGAGLDVAGTGAGVKHSGKIANYFHILNNPYALTILGIIFFAFLILCCCSVLCCCMMCRRKKKEKVFFFDECDENILKNVLISLYCGLKDSLNWTKLNPESSGEVKDSGPKQSTLDNHERPRPTVTPYDQNDPYIHPKETLDVPLPLTSESEEDSSTSSRD